MIRIVSHSAVSRRNFARPERLTFRSRAPEFVIDLDAIVNSQRRGVRYNEPSSKLARRSSRVVPHPEAGASVLGTINSSQAADLMVRSAPSRVSNHESPDAGILRDSAEKAPPPAMSATALTRDEDRCAPQSLRMNTDLILRSLRSKRLEGWRQQLVRGHPSRRAQGRAPQDEDRCYPGR
jgi:hypothetical protein